MARRSLISLLPELTHAHYGQLPGETVPALCRLLRSQELLEFTGYREYWFRMELLTALEKIDYARALPAVQQALREWPKGPQIQAAERLLAILAERKRKETERGSLLRGSERPAVSEAELLRAATRQTDRDPEQLLRPTL